MYKIAGELTPFVHARGRAHAWPTHALLDLRRPLSDVMAAGRPASRCCARPPCRKRTTSRSFRTRPRWPRAVALRALLRRLPHVARGGEDRGVPLIGRRPARDDADEELVPRTAPRAHAGSAPVLRGTAQNPDAFFQAREASSIPFHAACPSIVQRGDGHVRGAHRPSVPAVRIPSAHPEAERVIVIMGSGAETVTRPSTHSGPRRKRGRAEGAALSPLSQQTTFVQACPPRSTSHRVLDRTKEPGAVGEPLYQDVIAAITDEGFDAAPAPSRLEPRIIGGRYGLSSKEFTPAMVGRSSTNWQSRVRRTTSRSASWTT
jgi:pyruvate-ferredoxin/flavodoxin oxidoreductase